jgi:hypothetical protein
MAMGVLPGSGNWSRTDAMAADAAGNVYLAGTFIGTATLGSLTLSSSGDSPELFIAKWNTSRQQFMWAQPIAAGPYSIIRGLAVSGTQVYLVGTFIDTVRFGNIRLTSASSTSDVFVAKLTDAGSSASFVWGQRAGGIRGENATAIAVNGASVYIAGAFLDTAAFGSTVLTSVGPTGDAFIAKLTDDGPASRFTWVQQLGGPNDDDVTSLAVVGSSLYAAGSFQRATTIGTATLSASGRAGFVVKVNDTGPASNIIWAQQLGRAGALVPAALAASGTNLYVTGRFDGTATLGPTTLSSVGDYDLFVAKILDAGNAGNLTWAQQAGSPNYDAANSIAVSGSNVYLCGVVASNAQFGPISQPSGGFDVFVAKLTDAGSTSAFAWVQSAGGTYQDEATSLAMSGPGIYLGGYLNGPATFGSLAIAGVRSMVGFFASLAESTVPADACSATVLTIYPNPAHGTATVQVPPVPAASAVTFTLIDVLGRIVRTTTVALPDAAGLCHELDLTGLAPGLYAVQAAAGGYAATRRLLVY